MPEIRGEFICDRDETFLEALAFTDLKASLREIDISDIEIRVLNGVIFYEQIGAYIYELAPMKR